MKISNFVLPLKLFHSPIKTIEYANNYEELTEKQIYLIALPYAFLAPLSLFIQKTLQNPSTILFFYNLAYMFLYWGLKIFSLKAIVWFLDVLSPNFGIIPNEKKTLISVMMGIIPIWMGEVFNNFSELSKITFLLYIFGLFALYHSLIKIRGIAKRNVFEPLVFVLIIFLILNFFIGLFANLFIYGNLAGAKKF